MRFAYGDFALFFFFAFPAYRLLKRQVFGPHRGVVQWRRALFLLSVLLPQSHPETRPRCDTIREQDDCMVDGFFPILPFSFALLTLQAC